MNLLNACNAAAIIAAALQCPQALGQWSFMLDTSFRTTIQDRAVNSIALLENGQILASGMIRFPGDMSFRGSARLNVNGSRDLTFADFNGQGKLTPWQSKHYVAIAATVRRLHSNGYLDPSFISMNTGPYFNALTGGDYHVFPDGRVLLSGSHILSDTARGYVGPYRLIWFSNTGYLDTTRVHRQANGTIWEFKELPDGKFICTCSCSMYDGQPVSRLFRIHADGSLDPGFQPGVNWGNIYAYHALPDGRVYVGGRYKRAAAPNDTLYLARFMPDGQLDPAFNHLNTLSTLPGMTGGAKTLRLYPWLDGALFVTGVYQWVNGQPRGGICVLDSTGSLTTHMDECVAGPFSYQGSTNAAIVEMLPLPDGSGYYICGTYAGYTDGTITDPGQRFVSRLLVSELSTAVEEHAPPTLRLYPNPASSNATLQLEQVPPDAQLVLRDALGREVQRMRVSDHYTTLPVGRSGVYVVELWGNGERVATQRLVVE